MWDTIQAVLGLQTDTLSAGQIASRAVLVYAVLIVLVRLVGDRRFSGKHSAIDVILSIILGATLSRAINGSAPFWGTLGAGLVLVCAHWLAAALAFHFPRLEKFLKGRAMPLISSGDLNESPLRRGHITQRDLKSALRLSGHDVALSQVRQAALETNGDISLQVDPQAEQGATRSPVARTLEISVEAGVQTIRIQLEQ